MLVGGGNVDVGQLQITGGFGVVTQTGGSGRLGTVMGGGKVTVPVGGGTGFIGQRQMDEGLGGGGDAKVGDGLKLKFGFIF